MRLVGIVAQPLAPIFQIVGIVALEPDHLAVAFECEHVGGDPVEKPAIVRDHHCAAREIEQCFLQRAQRLDVEIVGRLVEQQHVAAALEQLGQVQPIALAAGELTDDLLLIGAAEVEARHVAARLRLVVADPDDVLPVGDFVEHRLLAIECIAALVDVRNLHRIAELERAGIGLLLAHQDAKHRGLARTVGADYPDDPARRQAERQTVEQQLVAIRFLQVLGLDHQATQARAGRDVDLVGLVA